MRTLGHLLNPLGFVLALLGLFLPFVAADIPPALGAGGWSWTGLDLMFGGEFSQNIVLLRPAQDGSLTKEPIGLVELYGQDYFIALHHLPALAAAQVAGVVTLLGVAAALLPTALARVTAAASAAIAAIACLAVAQIQAVRHVEHVWAAVTAAKPLQLRSSLFDPWFSPGYGFYGVVAVMSVLAISNVTLIASRKSWTV